MDSIGNIAQQIITAPTLPVAPAKSSQPALPVPGADAADLAPKQDTTFDPQAAEQARQATVQRISQQIANDFILGDQTFSLFKDSTGQYITRFTNLRDGKVTYIPEPTLFKLGGSGAESVRLLKIQA